MSYFSRELREECGLIASSLNKCGTIWFDNLEEPTTLSEVHIFVVEKFEGEIIESDGKDFSIFKQFGQN